MKGLKIAVIGGGSSYTPELIDGFIKRQRELPVREIWLVDVEEGQEKLRIVSDLAVRMLKKAHIETKIVATLDRSEALKDADFVLTQLRVGGLDARQSDEEIPLNYGVIGQETTGAGGFGKALRTIPVLLDLCRDIEKLAPKAWLINFTNPAGMVTEAVLKHSSVNIIGLCNVPITMKHNIAKILDCEPERLFIEYMGLNHLIWGKRIFLDGEDITPQVLHKLMDGESFSMKNIPDLKWPADLLSTLQMIPCPYLRYFYLREESYQEERHALEHQGTRATQVKAIEHSLFDIYKNPLLDEKPKELENRGGAYYSDAAVSLISAIFNDKNEIHTVNILNNGAIKNLPDNQVIEINAVVNKSGARGITLGDMPPHLHGMVSQVKAYEQLAIEAIVGNNPELAVLALVNHPLVGDAHLAKNLVQALYEANARRSL